MLNPFDLRTALLAKHAQHVVLVHFPVALFISGVAFDVGSRGKRCSALAAAAYWNLWAAAVSVLPTMATGVLAWQFALEGKRLRGLLLLHLAAAGLAAVLVLASWLIHRSSRQSEMATLPAYRVPVELFAACLIALTAHLGGFLSGVNS